MGEGHHARTLTDKIRFGRRAPPCYDPGMRRSEIDRLVRRASGGDPGACRRVLEAISAGALEVKSIDLAAVARALIASGRSEVDVRADMARASIGLLDRWAAVDRALGREPESWTWILVSYEVVGNAEYGWEVNDMHATGDEIVLPGGVSGEEAAKALVETGLAKDVLEVDYEEEHTIAFSTKGGRPVGEIRRTEWPRP